MMCKRLLFILATGALLLLQFGDCTSAMALDQQGMQCCRSMPCTPAHHSSRCCKDMTSAQTPNMLPAEHVSLRGPMVAAVEYPLVLEIVRSTTSPSVIVDAQQHSPPDLYTLNVSLLI
jgi:hypothetical protein